jgi:glycosyltransferase involved in cell wall biosynthesis
MNAPLTTVAVIAFNSEDYLTECLESIKSQTHYPIELIISDDASTDRTASLAEDWLKTNKSRFAPTSSVITANNNLGITGNVNRAARAARGEFIKFIAADDTLDDDAIATLVEAATQTGAKVVFSKVTLLADSKISKPDENFLAKNNYDEFFKCDINRKYNLLLRNSAPHTLIVGSLLKLDYLASIGYFDETYPMMEDYPILVKIFKNREKIAFVDKFSAKYRAKPESYHVENKISTRFRTHQADLKRFRKKIIIPELLKRRMIFSLIFTMMVNIIMDVETTTKSQLMLRLITICRRIRYSTALI